MNKKYIFFGSSPFSVVTLNHLAEKNFLPSLILTLPDRPAGRGLKLKSNEVKIWALENQIPVLELTTFNQEIIEKLEIEKPDFILVSAFGLILPKILLKSFRDKIINIHPSLLPKYRGASPLQTAILNNDKDTGVSLFVIDNKMDHGGIIAKEKYLGPWPVDFLALGTILFKQGVDLLLKIIDDFCSGQIEIKKQNDDLATYTKKITKADGEIDPTKDHERNYLKFLAFKEWPGVFYFKDGKRIKITEAMFKDRKFIIKKIIPEGQKEQVFQI